jgi:putative glutamine amidotransferase
VSGSAPPVVGLTTYLERARQGMWDVPAAYLQRQYVDGVTRAGGLAMLLPPQPAGPELAGTAVARVDALVLTGGLDVHADLYGHVAHPEADAPRRDRDAWELDLVRAALDRGLPVLGICRGAQVLNVALGGTLHQHLPEETGEETHRRGAGVFATNRVEVTPGSRLADVVGPEVDVACYHHQAVADLAPGLRVVARTSDGVVEAVEMPAADFVLAVQWHPEQTLDDLRLFTALVEAARRRTHPAGLEATA